MPRNNKTIHINDLPASFRGKLTNNNRYIQTGTPPIGLPFNKVANAVGLTRLASEFITNPLNTIYNPSGNNSIVIDKAKQLIDYFNKPGPSFPYNLKRQEIYTTDDGTMGVKKFAIGGRTDKIPNVVRGGVAKPLGNNFFYMSGRKHSQGGIDIGPNDKTGIEVEGGEVVETNGNELKVYSAQPIINGTSPAKLVMGGANPNKVFQAQENFKDRNGINDDGSKYKEGGKVYQISDEYKRQLAEKGRITIEGYPTIAGNRTYSYIKGLAKVTKLGRAATNLINIGRQKVYDLANKIDNPWISQAIKEVYRTTVGKNGGNLPRTIDYINNRKQEKFGGKDMIVSISGNVKNGLIHSPSSTGGKRNKFLIGGGRRVGGVYLYNTKDGSTYIANKEVDAITRAGNRNKGNYINKNQNLTDYGINDININGRPQYYAERNLPLFKDGEAISSGLIRAGWSHGTGSYPNINVNIPNIPNISDLKVKRTSPVKGGKTYTNTTNANTTNLPKITYNTPSLKVNADIPTKLPVGTNNPAQVLHSRNTKTDGRGLGSFKNITPSDWISLAGNIGGSLGSYFVTKNQINKMRGPGQPMLISANKLKTKHNINPQLDKIREDKFEAYRDIDSNTASSRVGLARKQRVRNSANQMTNQLYGNKENIETQLINQDKLNQQGVRQFNAQQYNQYLDRKTAFENGIREAKINNINNLFTGINSGIQDMITRYENRKALNNTIGAMRAGAPNVDDRIMRDAGVDYNKLVIRKRKK